MDCNTEEQSGHRYCGVFSRLSWSISSLISLCPINSLFSVTTMAMVASSLCASRSPGKKKASFIFLRFRVHGGSTFRPPMEVLMVDSMVLCWRSQEAEPTAMLWATVQPWHENNILVWYIFAPCAWITTTRNHHRKKTFRRVTESHGISLRTPEYKFTVAIYFKNTTGRMACSTGSSVTKSYRDVPLVVFWKSESCSVTYATNRHRSITGYVS